MLQTDPDFAAEALELWETNKTGKSSTITEKSTLSDDLLGPYTAYLNSVAFLPLNLISDKTDEIVQSILDQDPGEYLHPDSDSTVIAGYVQQKKTLAKQLQSDKSTLLEVPFSGNPFFSTVMLKSLSRGTLHLSPDDDGVDPSGRGDMEPVLDFRTFSNPADLDLVVEMIKGVRGFMGSEPMMEAFGAVETSPGENMTDEDELKALIARMMSPSTAHPIGTAAMAPRELGGVVGPELTVYGTSKLSIADNSIIPLIPSTHTSSTAYAIGEKVSNLDPNLALTLQ
jgi:choline dehydrogenase-like flavoprotein